MKNPGACLRAVDLKNLSVLVESGSHRLAKMVIDFYEVDKEHQIREENQPDSPFYAAAWLLLRQQDKLPFSTQPLQDAKVDVTKVLLWASRFGFHALAVTDHVEERTVFLQQTLIECSMNILDGAESAPKLVENQIVSLWSHIFAPLLKVGTKQGGVPHKVTLLLAAHQYPPKAEWPVLVQHLSAVLFGKADKTNVENLLNTDFFHRLHEKSAKDPDHSFSLPSGRVGTQFVTGLLTLGPQGAVLSRRWQVHLLTTPGVIIPDQFARYCALLKSYLYLSLLQSKRAIAT